MKNRILAVFAAALAFLSFANWSIGQTKVGYIDSKKIIDNMQEAKDAKVKLDELVSEWQKELNTLQDSLKRYKEDYDKKKLILSEQLKQQYETNIKTLETNVTNFKVQKFGEGGEYFQKQTEFMKPVQDRIFKAIETVAQKEDFDYVFDRNSDILLLYVNEKYDLTLKVQRVIRGKTMKVNEIAEILDGTIIGNPDIIINSAGRIESARPDQISFISNPLYEKYLLSTKAGAVIVSENFDETKNSNNVTLIKVRDPYLSFVKMLEEFEPEKETKYVISGLSSIGEGTEISNNILVDDFVKIGLNCKIGEFTRIFSNTSIGNNVEIGKGCIIHGNVTIYDGCKIGNNVIIHSNTVVGSDGFGFAKETNGKYKKIPQNGIVILEDDVEIGSGCTIDRATLGETRICRGAKLDNQIQIAHNVIIGEDTVIAAQVGIAGSTKVGKRCMIGGQSGLVGHINICDDVIIGAAVGISKSITKPGVYIGYRGKPIRESLRDDALISELPSIKEKIKNIENKINKNN